MTIKNLLLIAILLSTSMTFASPSYFKAPVFKIDAFAPGVEIEKAIYNTQTILLNGYWSYSYGTEGLIHIITIKSEYRYYYNIDQRITNQNSISKYSGDFVSLAFYYKDWSKADYENDYMAGPCWGMQRCFLDHFRWSFNLGVGYKTSGPWGIKASNIGLLMNVNLGFSFQL